jgi:TPR repeat protein
LYGDGVEKNYDQAAIYFEKACQLKNKLVAKTKRRRSSYKRNLTADINTMLSKFFDTYKVYE